MKLLHLSSIFLLPSAFLLVLSPLGLSQEEQALEEEINSLETSSAPAYDASDFPLLPELGGEVFELKDLEYFHGDPLVSSLDEKGKIYLLYSWATWCGPCIMNMPKIQQFVDTQAGEDIEVLAINVVDRVSKEEIKAFVDQNEFMTFPVAYTQGQDAPFALEWLIQEGRVISLPSIYVVKEGKLMDFTGSFDEATQLALQLREEGDSFDHDAYIAKKIEREQEINALTELVNNAYQEGNWQAILDSEERILKGFGEVDGLLHMMSALVSLEDYQGVNERLGQLPRQMEGSFDQLSLLCSIGFDALNSENLSAFSKQHHEALAQDLEKIGDKLTDFEALALIRMQSLAGNLEGVTRTRAKLNQIFEKGLQQGLTQERIDEVNGKLDEVLKNPSKMPPLTVILQ